MPYVVMVDDNFHYMDEGEDERYKHGEFADAGLAIGHCRKIVDEYLESAYKAGMSASDLWDRYVSFGEDPFILSVGAPDEPRVGEALRGVLTLTCQDREHQLGFPRPHDDECRRAEKTV